MSNIIKRVFIRGMPESHRRRCDHRSRGRSDVGPHVKECEQSAEDGKGKGEPPAEALDFGPVRLLTYRTLG